MKSFHYTKKSYCEGKYKMNTNFTNNNSGLWARESQHRFGLTLIQLLSSIYTKILKLQRKFNNNKNNVVFYTDSLQYFTIDLFLKYLLFDIWFITYLLIIMYIFNREKYLLCSLINFIIIKLCFFSSYFISYTFIQCGILTFNTATTTVLNNVDQKRKCSRFRHHASGSKPLKSIEATAIADRLSGGLSQKKPLYLHISEPTQDLVTLLEDLM